VRGSRINIGKIALFRWLLETFSAIVVLVPVDPKTLPSDAAALRKIVVDLTAQLDTQHSRLRKVEGLLAQLLEARNAKRSEQLSRDQLALFAAVAKAAGVSVEAIQAEPEDHDKEPPPSAGSGGAGKTRGRSRSLHI